MFNEVLFAEYVNKRVIKGNSLRIAADDCGVAASVLCRIRNGSRPSLKTVETLCSFMDVSPQTFFFRELGEE